VTEYFAECFMPKSDVWLKYPSRMLRHKALIQAARYAFGYSGIVDPDEAARFTEAPGMTVQELSPPPAPKPAQIEEAAYTAVQGVPVHDPRIEDPEPSFAPLGGQDEGPVPTVPPQGPGELEKEVVPPSDSPPGPTPVEIAKDIVEQLEIAQTLAQLDEVITANETEINDLPQYERNVVEGTYDNRVRVLAPKPPQTNKFESVDAFKNWAKGARDWLENPAITKDKYEEIGDTLRANVDWLKTAMPVAEFDKLIAYCNKLMKHAAETIHAREQPGPSPATPSPSDLSLTWDDYVAEVDRMSAPGNTYMAAQNWWWDTDPLRKGLVKTVTSDVVKGSKMLDDLKKHFHSRRDQLPK
jgi:hypothetical protein